MVEAEIEAVGVLCNPVVAGANATQPERVCVIGCGTIGGLFVAHLAQLPDVEVWADDADPADVAAINRMVGRNETRARKTEG